MERAPKRLYSPEFQAEAVKLIDKTELSVNRAAKQLSIPKSSLGNGVRAAKKGQLTEVGKRQRVPSEQELELAKPRKELAEVKQEHDLLKNLRRISRRTPDEIRPD